MIYILHSDDTFNYEKRMSQCTLFTKYEFLKKQKKDTIILKMFMKNHTFSFFVSYIAHHAILSNIHTNRFKVFEMKYTYWYEAGLIFYKMQHNFLS